MRLTTRTLDGLRAKQTAFDGTYADAGLGMDSSGGAPGLPGMDAVSSQIIDYLSEMTAADQRSWRAKNIWSDIAIRHRMDDLRDNAWTVGRENARKEVDADLVAEITDVLDAPNAALEDNTFGGMWGAALDDVYTIGRGTIQKIVNRNRTPRAFRALDAARLRQNPQWNPNRPDVGPRWLFHVGSGTPEKEFKNDEIILIIPYMSTHDRTGLSPMKALGAILQAELDTRRKMHYAQKYGTPPGAFVTPGAAPGTPEKARYMYDLRVAGKPGIIFMNLPQNTKFIPFGDLNLLTQGTFQFYEILVRATAASFGTTPFVLGWTDQDNRANSQTQLTLTDRGETAMLKLVRAVINRYVIGPYKAAYGSRADNIWFTFKALREEDEAEDAASLERRLGKDIDYISINDVRVLGGFVPYEQEEIPDYLWPFVNDVWVPSRLRGIRLPLTYAAMTWGIGPGKTEDEILDALEESTTTNPLPIAMSGDDVEDVVPQDGAVKRARRALIPGRNDAAEETLAHVASLVGRR